MQNPPPSTPLTIDHKESLAAAIDLLNRSPVTRTLIVVNGEGRVVGTLTDGDIRRWLRPEASAPLRDSIDLDKIAAKEVMNSSPTIVRSGESMFAAITKARELDSLRDGVRQIRILPIVDDKGRLIDVLDLMVSKQRTRLEVILMAKARLDGITTSPDQGRYLPCTSHERFVERRDQYDTVRYAYQKAKYSALAEVVMNIKEVASILSGRRFDELYMALSRGQEWAASCQPPDPILAAELQSLSKQLKDAKVNLFLEYVHEGRRNEYLGDQTAASKPDVVFVLGCKEPDVQSARVDACLKFLDKKTKHLPRAIVLSGGGFDPISRECEQMQEVMEVGLKNCSKRLRNAMSEKIELIHEEESLDTVGNAVFGQLALIDWELYDPNRPTEHLRICVFTSDFHAYRTLGLFQRVFHDAAVAVRFSSSPGETLQTLADKAAANLESEARANSEAFALENPVTGLSNSISSGHIRSVFFQLLRHHAMYRHRPDLIRTYAKVLKSPSGTRRKASRRTRKKTLG